MLRAEDVVLLASSTDWCCICSNADTALVCCGKDGVNQEGIYIPTLAYSQEFGYKPEESQTQVQI